MPPVDLLLATQNPGKLAEMRLLAEGLPFRVLGPRELGIGEAPEETGATFIENAVLKARHYARLSGRLTVADDSGLSVDALGGGPGLYSARFGGPGLDDAGRTALLLERLRGVPPERRTARFRCVIAIVEPGGREQLVEGVVEGRIADAPRGDGGFGYDPVFFYSPLGGTFGEIDAEAKHRVSHRGAAARAAAALLLTP